MTSIKIAAFGALTGPVQSFGINSRAALLAAAQRIDRDGGVKLADGSVGHFDISYTDDHCNADDAIAFLKQAAAADTLVAIGPSCSSVAEPLYGTLQHKVDDNNDPGLRIPVFTDGATKANLARLSEWAFRNSPNEGDMYESLWAWVRQQYPGVRTVYTAEESDFAHSHSTLQNIISKKAIASGLQVLGNTGWSINDTAFEAPAKAIGNSHADVVVISAHARTTCGVLTQLAQQNIHPKLLIGLTSASTPETLSLCGPAADGLVIPTSFVANTPERQRQAHEVEAMGGIADLHSMAGWEILFTLQQAIEQSGIVPGPQTVASDRRKLRDTLAHLQTMNGVMGTINRTPQRESLKPFVLVRAEHGAWKVISSSTSAQDVHGQTAGEEHFLIPFEAGGLRLFLRHLPPLHGSTAGTKSVLFVHGATFPSALAAAYPFGGHSWMEDLARAGIDSWALDFMGYGGSDRYPPMSDPAATGAPLLRTEEASRQIEAAMRFIRDKQHMQKLSIIAHSWGTLPSGLLATRHPDLLDRLVLFGPVALRHEHPDDDSANKPAPAWNVTVEAQRKRFYGYVPRGEAPVLAASDMALWGPAYLASDPNSGQRTPPSVRVPYGPLADLDRAWSGHFPYDPSRIRVPVLIIRGEWDDVTTNKDAHWLYESLRNAPVKRDVVISRGTHVMHLEASRFQLYREVQTFVEGADAP
ncbi:MAG: alpha/beta fold hydrolase [Proteobacteria bacterium]|nr:alpha/beta fold hydrolase [Pseudomonadota bacterium]